MSREDLIRAEAGAALGRALAGRSKDISLEEAMDVARQLDSGIGTFAIQAQLRAAGFLSLGGGMYRKAPKIKPPRPRRPK